MSWRRFNAAGVVFSVLVWIVATITGIISSVAFVSHVSLLALALAFVAAWRSDVPTDPCKYPSARCAECERCGYTE